MDFIEKLAGTSLKISNYKCFGEDPQGFDGIRPINILIGKNNAGKSALIDVVEYAMQGQVPKGQPGSHQQPILYITGNINAKEMANSKLIDPTEATRFAGKAAGKPVTVSFQGTTGKPTVKLVQPDINLLKERYNRKIPDAVLHVLLSPLLRWSFLRLCSDRDMQPEQEMPLQLGHRDFAPLAIDQAGNGASHCIQEFLNDGRLDNELVRKTMLGDLNTIYSPDEVFSAIDVKRAAADKRENWEVCLDVPNIGLVRLSDMGSGLRTILLVLSMLYLVPKLEERPRRSWAFAFEELENNLHPSLLRQLLKYLFDKVVEEKFILFLSTHSSVAIDIASQYDAQIVHVQFDDSKRFVESVHSYAQIGTVLDDLGVRASDLYQSNCIIWVEGPSDRIYVRKWIDLWLKGQLIEGFHYKCVFYGGSLIAHLSAEEPDKEQNDLLKMLLVNRHAAILIDSDLKSEDDKIAKTKQRLLDEVESSGGMGWITKGREIENYIPQVALDSEYPDESLPPLGKLEGFVQYLNIVKSGEGDRFKNNKVGFAKRFVSHMERDDLASHLDLKEKLDRLCKLIKQWNHIPA